MCLQSIKHMHRAEQHQVCQRVYVGVVYWACHINKKKSHINKKKQRAANSRHTVEESIHMQQHTQHNIRTCSGHRKIYLFDLKLNRLQQAQWLVIRHAGKPASCHPTELWRNVHVVIPLADIWKGPDRDVRGVLRGLTLVAAHMTGG